MWVVTRLLHWIKNCQELADGASQVRIAVHGRQYCIWGKYADVLEGRGVSGT